MAPLGLEPCLQLIGGLGPREQGVEASLQARLDVGELTLELGTAIGGRAVLPPQTGGRLLDGLLQDPLVEGLDERLEHHLVELVLADQEPVRADLRAALVVEVAAIEPASLPFQRL